MLELLVHVVVEQAELESINVGSELCRYPFKMNLDQESAGDVVA